MNYLKKAGAHEVRIDNGEIYKQIEESAFKLYDRVLELIGTTTLLDSLRCVGRGGIVCITGILGGKWTLDNQGRDKSSIEAFSLNN